MSADANANRLWVQVTPSSEAARAEAFGMSGAIAADLLASGVGAMIKSAADRLIAADQYSLKTVLAYEPGFVIRANAASPSFLLDCITLNVGPKAVPIHDPKTGVPLSSDAMAKTTDYAASPVVIRLEVTASADRTALAARVTHWKYVRFLDPSRTWFRKRRRKVTVELKISDVEGNALLATAMQVDADLGMIGNVRPNDGERLPWMKRPVKSFSGERVLAEDQWFGPVNIEASITEVAEPSAFAKVLATTLGNQKAAIEAYVKDHLTRTLDEAEEAKANLARLTEASTARDQYETAYTAVTEARKKFDAAPDEGARVAAKHALDLRMATLRQKEILARVTFDRAGLLFEEMPAIQG